MTSTGKLFYHQMMIDRSQAGGMFCEIHYPPMPDTRKNTTLKYPHKKENKMWMVVSKRFPFHNAGEYTKN